MTLTGHFIDDVQRRDNAVALALYAVNAPVGRHVGDPVHGRLCTSHAMVPQGHWDRAHRSPGTGHHPSDPVENSIAKTADYGSARGRRHGKIRKQGGRWTRRRSIPSRIGTA